ncbi:MAG TPA: beta-N-acetylhexosaminidase [Candidatus Lokiarchaeia archaeon]|nr:beta-N-acetylhexosaminidase [Candidatus Lokiarchaeia archaeon]
MDEVPAIIPAPVKLARTSGMVEITSDTRIVTNEEPEQAGHFLKKLLDPVSNFSIPVENDVAVQPESGLIVIKLDPGLATRDNDAYSLNVTRENGIAISSATPQGAFYGVQTLRQLLPAAVENSSTSIREDKWPVPCVTIDDYSRFSWRGFMLDVGRHFVTKETVKKIIDVMACLKMNIFHWHLTDDQGWRIEIKKYPRLVDVGSKRTNTQVGGYMSPRRSGKPHEGYYTQDNVQEIVEYARERFMIVVPEIEAPGHCMAALAAYPELSCTGGPFEVPAGFGIKADVMCPGKDTVFTFMDDVLDEVLAIFPSNIIHVGGDETPRARWKKCPDCQERIRAENLANEPELQTYFTNRVAKYLETKGRTIMGWNEILSADLSPGAIVQFWKGGTKQILPHAVKGRKFVMSAFFHVYFDHDYVLLPLGTVYDYDPVPHDLPDQYHENVLGIEVPLWTEWVRDEHRLYWQLFPRLLAAAEVGWTLKENKSFNDFKQRVPGFCERLKFMGIGFAPLDRTEPAKIRRLFSPVHIFFEPRIPKTY